MPSIAEHLSGREYWRSLEHLARTPSVREATEREFAGYEPDSLLALSRRRFVQLMGASMALAGLTLSGCRRWPQEKLAPFAYRPEGYVPGEPMFYATALELGGVATGALVRAYDGRPIKIEGNPEHPSSHGASTALMQAALLEMYDPDRSRFPVLRGEGAVVAGEGSGAEASVSGHEGTGAEAPGLGGGGGQRISWDEAVRRLGERVKSIGGNGSSLAVLAESMSGPTVARLRAALSGRWPGARWYEYEPISRDREIAGARLAFGSAVRPRYDLEKARVIALFDCDLLADHPTALANARGWAAGRRSADRGRMNRVYAVESTYTQTGSVADERLPITAGEIPAVVAAVLRAMRGGEISGAEALGLSDAAAAFAGRLVADLRQHPGESVLIAGRSMPAEVHAACHAINDHLGNFHSTVFFTAEPDADRPEHLAAIKELTDRLVKGEVTTLLILGGNPVYDAPADVRFAEALAKAAGGEPGSALLAVHLSLYDNETSQSCRLHLPRAHWLESWGDARSWDGTVSVVQPLIQPLFDGKTPAEVLSAWIGDEKLTGGSDAYSLTRTTLWGALPGATEEDKEKSWRRVLHDGLMKDSGYVAAYPKLGEGAWALAGAGAAGRSAESGAEGSGLGGAFELTFPAGFGVYDGRFANNGWLQETADPMTKLTWDNAAMISVADARRLKLTNGDVVKLTAPAGEVEAPVYILPGQPVGTLALALGYGRTAAGRVGSGVGVNAYRLRSSSAPHATPVRLQPTGGKHPLAMTVDHHLIDDVGYEGRQERAGKKGQPGKLVREATLAAYLENPRAPHGSAHGNIGLQLFPQPHAFNKPHAWGMAIDTNSCTGCSACVVACQAENNVPIVGKDMVLMSREMGWIRVDRYFKGRPDDPNPQVVHQPLMCVHCENAPCEQVCPVAATVHDTEGLNTMVYNRCIGTRYCSNNCPFKVRRFNYFDYHSKFARTGNPSDPAVPWLNIPDTQQNSVIDDLRKMMFNPEVTVRMRGVMEKCTLCTQRIAAGRIAAKVAFRQGERDSDLVRDGEVLTACQQACPTRAIVFGDLNDPRSNVSRMQQNPRAYEMLAELNLRTRGRHLAKLRNPAESQTSPGGQEGHASPNGNG